MALEPYYQDSAVTIYHGDANELYHCLEPQSIDLIMTDPPYLKEYIGLYKTVGDAAIHLCKPGSFVYAYCGGEFLPQAMNLMMPPLDWFYLFNIKHNGGTPRLWYKHLMVTSKPVIVCTVGKVAQDGLKWCANDCTSVRMCKSNHEWEQSPGFPTLQIDLRTKPGDTVLDLFGGGGTTARAAKNIGRKCILFEIEESACETCAKRMAQEALSL